MSACAGVEQSVLARRDLRSVFWHGGGRVVREEIKRVAARGVALEIAYLAIITAAIVMIEIRHRRYVSS